MPSNRSDRELVDLCLDGRESSWRDLILRYRRLIYSIPVSFGGIDADDVFQTVATRLFENLGTLRKRDSLASWLATTTRRECLAAARKARRTVSLDDQPAIDAGVEPPDFVRRVFEIECEHKLTQALERLDELCRNLLRALYVEEPTPSYKEISTRIGRPVGSLGPTRGRCLQKLRDHYLELGGETPPGVSTDPPATPVE